MGASDEQEQLATAAATQPEQARPQGLRWLAWVHKHVPETCQRRLECDPLFSRNAEVNLTHRMSVVFARRRCSAPTPRS